MNFVLNLSDGSIIAQLNGRKNPELMEYNFMLSQVQILAHLCWKLITWKKNWKVDTKTFLEVLNEVRQTAVLKLTRYF